MCFAAAQLWLRVAGQVEVAAFCLLIMNMSNTLACYVAGSECAMYLPLITL
jgi:hypothetical protein